MLHSYFKILFSGLLMLIYSSVSLAQDISVSAKLDTTSIMIGDQVKLHFSVTRPAGQKVLFPSLPDTLGKIDVVERSKIDTLVSENKSIITERQTVIITSFDSGYYAIAPFKFALAKDTSKTFETEALLLSVSSPQVDTTLAIKDIKGPMDVPFTFREAVPYILGGFAILAVIIALYYYFKKRKKEPEVVEVKLPSRPPHEIALEELNKLKEEKVWQTQNDGMKIYHSRISDIVRTYIEHRYKIPAMELTTDEILNNFKRSSMSEELKEKLKQLLVLSDFVKFAKAQPLPNENELSLANAYDFINFTIPKSKAAEGKETEL